MQALFAIPELASRYVDNASAIYSSAPANPADDLPSQLAKVGVALVQGKTGNPPPLPVQHTSADAAAAAPGSGPEPMDVVEEAAGGAAAAAAAGGPQDAAHAGGGQAETAAQEANSVRPVAFKALVGKGHPEFSSGRQQVCIVFFPGIGGRGRGLHRCKGCMSTCLLTHALSTVDKKTTCLRCLFNDGGISLILCVCLCPVLHVAGRHGVPHVPAGPHEQDRARQRAEAAAAARRAPQPRHLQLPAGGQGAVPHQQLRQLQVRCRPLSALSWGHLSPGTTL